MDGANDCGRHTASGANALVAEVQLLTIRIERLRDLPQHLGALRAQRAAVRRAAPHHPPPLPADAGAGGDEAEQVVVGGGGEEDVLERVGREVGDGDALEREAARAARRRHLGGSGDRAGSDPSAGRNPQAIFSDSGYKVVLQYGQIRQGSRLQTADR